MGIVHLNNATLGDATVMELRADQTPAGDGFVGSPLAFVIGAAKEEVPDAVYAASQRSAVLMGSL